MDDRSWTDLEARSRALYPAGQAEAMLAGMREVFGTLPGDETELGTDQAAAELVLRTRASKPAKAGHIDDECVSAWDDIRRMTHQAMIAGTQDALRELSR